jgi:hypothetical protein
MHGNKIKNIKPISRAKEEESNNFSMLKANPDMYQATLKKFRKYNLKTP